MAPAERKWNWDRYRHVWAEHVLFCLQVVDNLKAKLADGGCILDYHGCDFFPEEQIDLVVVLRTETSVLYDRLKARLAVGFAD